jgi:prevent-host-death family protein
MTMVTSSLESNKYAFCVMTATISASQFKARCLGLMDQVAASGEVLVITKNGQPVAELHP